MEDTTVKPAAWKCSRCGNTSDTEGVMPNDNWCCSCAAIGDMQPMYDQTALDTAVAAERKDAARYRWLLEHSVSENDDGEKCIYYWCDFEHYDDVSASIDAAME